LLLVFDDESFSFSCCNAVFMTVNVCVFLVSLVISF